MELMNKRINTSKRTITTVARIILCDQNKYNNSDETK